MARGSRSSWLFLVGFIAVGLSAGSSAVPQARVGGATPQARPARLSGIVLADDPQPQPLHAAIVRLAGSQDHEAVTDDEGRFAFEGIAPGTYRLTVEKVAYLRMEHGANGPQRPGTPIALAAGQAIENLTIRLPRGAVITGVVRDLDGQPAPNVSVSVTPSPSREPVLTDDRGEYRIWGLMPGEYLVSAEPPRTLGSTGSMPMFSVAEMDAALAELARTHGRGGGRTARTTSGGVTARQAAAALPPPAVAPAPASSSRQVSGGRPTFAFAPSFYPGTAVRERAVPVRVAAGEVRSGIDIPLMLSGTTRIAGTFVRADGQPFTQPPLPASPTQPGAVPLLLVTALPRGQGAAGAGFRPSVQVNRETGAFEVVNVVPGAYRISARYVEPPVPQVSDDGRPNGPPVRPTRLWAIADVDVSTAEVTGLTLTLQPALTVTGRLIFDRSSLAVPADPTNVRVTLVPVDAGAGADAPISLQMTSTTSPDGMFAIGGVLPGTYQFSAVVPGIAPVPGWWLRSAMLDGTDLLDLPPEIGPATGNLSGVLLTLTDRHTALEGTFSNPAGTPATDYFIVAFPADRALWHPASRRLAFTRPATDGSFRIDDLPPGEYLVVALDDLDPDRWRTSSFLEELVPGGVRVAIREGLRTRQDLRIAR